MKHASPFTFYFDNVINKIRISISYSDNISTVEDNPYYFPGLLDIITDQLYVMPLWTSCMITQAKQQFPGRLDFIKTSLSNNFSESNIMHTKHCIFNKRKNLMTSEISCKMYSNIKSKFYRHYEKPIEKSRISTNQKLNNIEEIWKKGKKRNGNKGYWFDNHKNFDFNNWQFETETDILNNEQFDEAFDQPKDGSQYLLNRLVNNEDELIDYTGQMIKKIYYFVNKTNSFSNISYLFQENRLIIEKFIGYSRSLNTIRFTVQNINDTFNFEAFLKKNQYFIENEFSVANCSPNGNCFYNALSILLFNSEKYYDIIKICIFYVILDNFSSFALLAEHNKNGDLKKSLEKYMKDETWANELIIMAASLYLNRPIISFSVRPNKQIFDLSFDSLFRPLLIAYNMNHFAPILCKNDPGSDILLNIINQYSDFKAKFSFKDY